HEMWLPVLDFRNKAMTNPTMFDVNKSVMRCLTKNLAMFGLGLYIYAGEDLPEQGQQPTSNEPDFRTLINNAINHPNCVDKKDDYVKLLKDGVLKINQETLDKICRDNNIC
ncbi:MAG: DUF1071 domain-containing protein, partial [Cyclobacteriaceae bacterium]